MGEATKPGPALHLPQKANSQPQPLSPPTFSTASVIFPLALSGAVTVDLLPKADNSTAHIPSASSASASRSTP
jgi:hypothetical protein